MQESDARERCKRGRALHASLYICRYDRCRYYRHRYYRCRYYRLDLITVNLTYLHIWPVRPRSDRSDRSARSAQNDRNTPLWTWALYGLNSQKIIKWMSQSFQTSLQFAMTTCVIIHILNAWAFYSWNVDQVTWLMLNEALCAEFNISQVPRSTFQLLN